MNSILLLIMVYFTKVNSLNYTKSLLDAFYWEVKPYVFRNSDGEMDGIIPRIFEEGLYYCSKGIDEDTKLIEFKNLFSSRKSFSEQAISFNDTIRKTNYSSEGRTFWAPVLSYIDRNTKNALRKRGLASFQLLKSKTIVVIVARHHISLPHKIFRGILSCQQIFVLALLLAIFFGIVVWLPERLINKDFHEGFIKGTSIGLWWSIVSMTTVGYGDIAPKSVLGRLVAVIWLVIGVMIACVMTATMTDVVTGVGDVNIHNRKVSVLAKSHEAKVASNDYRADVVPADSYEEVIELVRKQKVFAAMINEDVAAWYQDEIHNDSSYMPLRIVQKLPANLYVNCFISANISDLLKSVFRCMHIQKDEIYSSSQEHFQRYCTTQVLYVDSLKDLFLENSIIQVLLGIVFTLLFIGILFDSIRYFKVFERTPKPEESIRMKLFENGNGRKHSSVNVS